MRKSIIIPSVIVATIILGIVGFSSQMDTDLINEKTPLKIAINVWPGYSYAFLAQELGYFDENNVEVELVLRQEYSETQDLFDNQMVDGTFQVYTDTLFNDPREIFEEAIEFSNQYGYAVIMMHPQDFSLFRNGEYTSELDYDALNDLQLLLELFENSGLSIVPIGQINQNYN